MLAATLASMAPAAAYAQEYENTPVTISSEKVKVDGKVCYSHIVLERQTLFSISKAYNVSLEDIYKYNPSVKENGLKKNSIIMIPTQSESKETVSEQMPAEELKPETAQQTATDDDKPKTVEASVHKIHTVRWYESLKDIAAKHNVPEQAIIAINNLTGSKVKNRQKLIIPSQEYAMSFTRQETDTNIEEEDYENVDLEIAFDSVEEEDSSDVITKRKIKATLLLPLKATGSTSSKSNMDFYSGALIAVRELGESSIDIDLNVYDVASGAFGATRHELESSDIVIGPVSSADLTAIYEAAPEIKALVSPLDPKAGELVKGRPAFIQAPTPHMIQYMDLVSWMKDDMKEGDRCLLITEKGARPTEAVAAMIAAADSSGIEYKTLSYSILEGRNVTESLTYLMAENAANRVYIASESEAFVNDVVRNLNLMIHKKYDVVLYAPSKIRSFETIEVENFHNTSLHVSTGYYIDYENPMVKEFLLNYRALFNTEPTQFAYQGYDLARYFITLCSKYGKRWMDKLDEHTMSLLQNTFYFQKTEDGGYQNNGVRRIIYDDDWKVNRVR